MRCLNCNRTIPQEAKVCAHCEAPITDEPTAEELEAARDLIDQLPSDVASELRDICLDSATGEDFANRILVGNCPKCGSLNTSNCENDPDIGDLLVGRCYDCGQLWCTECDRMLEPKAPVCDCWTESEAE